MAWSGPRGPRWPRPVCWRPDVAARALDALRRPPAAATAKSGGATARGQCLFSTWCVCVCVCVCVCARARASVRVRMYVCAFIELCLHTSTRGDKKTHVSITGPQSQPMPAPTGNGQGPFSRSQSGSGEGGSAGNNGQQQQQQTPPPPAAKQQEQQQQQADGDVRRPQPVHAHQLTGQGSVPMSMLPPLSLPSLSSTLAGMSRNPPPPPQ